MPLQSFASSPAYHYYVPECVQQRVVNSLLDCTNNLRKVQELESKFNDAYSQSLSTKDERIQVLEKRVEETIRDNTQLREDLMEIRKQNERLKEHGGGTNVVDVSPRPSPRHLTAADSSPLTDSGKLRERVGGLQDKVCFGGCGVVGVDGWWCVGGEGGGLRLVMVVVGGIGGRKGEVRLQ